MQRNTFLRAALVSCVLAAAGCKDAAEKPEVPTATKTGSEPVSTAAIAAQAKGFTVGSAMSVRTVYVFFDPQCPHCGVLWESAKPLKSQAKFIWIPVGLINANSTLQGAALLAAADPVATMDEHEISLRAKQGGMKTPMDLPMQKEQVKANTELLTRMGFAAVPTIVGTHAQTGVMVKNEGAMPTAALATMLGLQMPGG